MIGIVSLFRALLAALALVASGAGMATSEPSEPAASSTLPRVRADLEAFVGERIEGDAATVEWPELRAFDFDPSNAVGEVRTVLSTRSATPLRGRVAITVSLYVGDLLVKRGVVSPYVKVPERLVATARPLTRGHVLGEADLVYSERDRATAPGDAMRDPAALVGLRLKRSLGGEQLVREGDVERVPLVERGDRVTLMLQHGPLLIQAIGRAQETGAVGDWIRVVNLDSKRELSGRLDREGRVHVAF